MNGKKAKSLRRLAEMKTVDMPAVSHKQINEHYKVCGTVTGADGRQWPHHEKVSQQLKRAA